MKFFIDINAARKSGISEMTLLNDLQQRHKQPPTDKGSTSVLANWEGRRNKLC